MRRLLDFLREHHVASLSTAGEAGPYATPLYYAVQEEPLALLFLSDPATRHMRHLAADPRCAMGVYLETRRVGDVRGAQLRGTVETLTGDAEEQGWRLYRAAFPEAVAYRKVARAARLHAFHVDWAKLTDNRLGFGTKLEFRPGQEGNR